MLSIIKSAFGKLKKNLNENYEHYLTIYLIINVIWIFLGIFLYNYSSFLYSDLSLSYIVFLILNILIILFSVFIKKVKFNLIDIFLILLSLFGIISTLFAHNKGMSLYGFRDRFEGLFQLLYYYSLMFLSTFVFDSNNKKKIINFLLFFGLINCFVCLLQVFNILRFIPINYRCVKLGQGLVTNSNFLGSYMILCLGISTGMFLYDKSYRSYIYLVLSLCFYSTLLMSNALSGMVGLFIICILIIAYFIYLCIKKQIIKLNILKHFLFLISCLVVSIYLTYSNKTVMFNDVKRLFFEASEISKGNFNDSYGTSRMFIWKNTLEIVPNHLLHGVGIDNFYYAFGDEPLFKKTAKGKIIFYDKAHNEYLQKLVCEGIFSCITYLLLLLIIFVGSFKRIIKEKKYVVIALFLSFVGYCVQAFFNISVIEVAPLFWIVCGLLYERKKERL